MIYDATDDTTKNQLLRLLSRAAHIFARGFCKGIKELNGDFPEGKVTELVMVHMDQILEQLSEQFGIEWSIEDRTAVETHVRGVCLSEFMPF
jgi:hypothetical protein